MIFKKCRSTLKLYISANIYRKSKSINIPKFKLKCPFYDEIKILLKLFSYQTQQALKCRYFFFSHPVYILLSYETMIRHLTLTAFASVAKFTFAVNESSKPYRVCLPLDNCCSQILKSKS